MKTHESEEMYLETILRLSAKEPELHAVEVAAELGFSRPSVSKALGLLRQKRYITVDRVGHIHLTDAGRQRAEAVFERHRVLTRLLVAAGAPADIAEDNACRIEHVVTEELFGYLRSLLQKIEAV